MFGLTANSTPLSRMKFSYQIEITNDHFIEFRKILWSKMRNEPEVHRWYGRISLLLFVAVAALTVFAIDFASGDPPFQQSFFLVLSGVLIFGWVLANRWYHTFALGKWAIGSHTILGEETITISSSGIVAVGLQHRSECSWCA